MTPFEIFVGILLVIIVFSLLFVFYLLIEQGNRINDLEDSDSINSTWAYNETTTKHK